MTIFSRIFSLLAALPTTKGPPRTSNHTYTLQYTSNSTNFFDKFEVLKSTRPYYWTRNLCQRFHSSRARPRRDI
ncbi:hypothetical protein E2P81_ATG05192 [Venturia nashicola]|uniref:Secreted protein n=1 Tax=Venturia nashicola TaxID=86259 RepID=A0A4Z1NX02_9PEZI|nr:hypothetical protein E6O75_ATG05321 [Venturia nashicola]TLD32216.1 hypothetical protein E2P81_ATG05192 [Venturia nashicola]